MKTTAFAYHHKDVMIFIFIFIFNSTQITAQKNSGILGGFSLMCTPRSEVAVGSVWTIDGIGPTGTKCDSLKYCNSFTRCVITKESKVDYDLGVKIAVNYGFGASFLEHRDSKIILDSGEIVTADFSRLKLDEGTKFIHECLRVKKISFQYNNEIMAKVSVYVDSIQKPDSLSAQFTGSRIITKTYEGANLYIGYKLVSIERVSTSRIRDVKEFKSKIGFKIDGIRIGDNFTIKFYDLESYIKGSYPDEDALVAEVSNQRIWPKGDSKRYLSCGTVMVATSHSKEIKFLMECTENYYMDDYTYKLSQSQHVDFKQQYLTVDFLRIENFIYMNLEYKESPKFVHIQARYEISSFVDKKALSKW